MIMIKQNEILTSRDRRRIIAQAGIFLALACLLEYLTFFIPRMPNGGRLISLGMIPLIIFAILNGWRWGVAAGFAFGFLFYLIDPFFLNPLQFILDYPIAFGIVGFAGIVKPNDGRAKIFCGIILACFLRFISHFLSGIIFFKAFIPGSMNPYIYSLGYNGSFMIPTAIVCCVMIPPMLKRFKKFERY